MLLLHLFFLLRGKDETDDGKVHALASISRELEKELSEYEAFRTSKLNRLRAGSAVTAITFEGDRGNLLVRGSQSFCV